MHIQDAIDRVGFGRFQRRLFLLCGITWAADAAEILLLSFALPGVTEEFGLTSGQAGLVVASTFAGMLAGAWFWGIMADRVGRRLGFQLTIAIFAVFGVASAFAPGPVWLAVLRALTGFGLGGAMPLDFALFTEYLPTRDRGRWLVLLESWWAVGTVAAAALALIIMPTVGWRWLLATSAAAALLVLWARLRVPESARYLLARGDVAGASVLVAEVARINGVTPPARPLQLPAGQGAATPGDLLRGALGRTTLLLWTVWLLIGFGYYGIFAWLPQIFADEYGFLRSYQYVFFLALAQLPGYLSAAWLVERAGRKPVLAGYLAAAAVATFGWAVADTSAMVLLSAGLMNFFTLGAWAALYAYTPERYPTQLRASGLGAASGFARIGAVTAPLAGGALLALSLPVALTVFAAAFLLAALAVAGYAAETRGTRLDDTVAERVPLR
ncbi:putative MFS transporter [Actinoplanes campanulatus]|uniref:Putative MFS transporter n=1 Tax=Actinoplanes campanulatus TaxID=113559 RepID=A0A7W5AQM6_9ACTN|nr:MFS transporter [Actinoplanes campanulatus]MBB3100667.1 putative MFS transporter [Actinoplanes campanulatus]GGN45591.1 MFS transporter [Actinoplanes campanulatus]GID41127.1 MFS transporter [Actinoplanes campanulatus]